MISIPRRLALTALLAVSFVLLRIVYAFVFSGLDGKDVLFALPEFRLGGPFRHISFFGNVSTDGILRNLELSIPFALTILIFGSLANLITPKKIHQLAKSARVFKKLLTAIAIAFASIPSLLQSAKKMAYSAALRKESRFAILIPLFERTVVAAGEVGLAISRSEPRPAVSRDLVIKDFKVGPLGPVDVTFPSGSIHVITGDTGSGKTTLLQFIAGQLNEHFGRNASGSVKYGEYNFGDYSVSSSMVSLVRQFPELGELADQVQVGEERKKPWNMSHGETYLASIQSELLRDPSVILLDEPAGALDSKHLSELLSLCDHLAKRGKIVIIAEHRISGFSGLSASYWRIEEGRLIPGMKFANSLSNQRQTPIVGKEVSVEISMSEIGFSQSLMRDVDLSVRQGELLAITGDNGTGKTTFLNHIATATSGVAVHGVPLKGIDPTQVALVPENVSDFFVTASLSEELLRADKVAKVPPGFTQTTFESLIGSTSELLKQHPLDLSVGTQLALATAMQLSHKPHLLLLDEPVQGLDSKARAQLAETLRCVQETGCAVIFATHDLFFAHALANRVYVIENQQLSLKAGVKS